MSSEIYKNYLIDMVSLIKNIALDAKLQKDHSSSALDNQYKIGFLMAYHDIISLMKEQANIFGIQESEIGLNDIDPDSELL